jgi:ABC-type polysaccharide/polyol phosphate transport system ATPase subunit
MQSEAVIEFTEVTKAYPAKHHPFIRMAEAVVGRPFGASVEAAESGFAVLKGVTFKVSAGEAIGLIGRNGAGKSTLLQIMAGVLQPSSGQLSVRGRLAALLELGAGFNPEFTGRENVALAGAMVGIQSSEMRRYAEEVLDFSELGEAFDRPVKTYSSGMYARLGFSAYICQRPDIMVIDEALSVGDMRFQNKCFSRISELRELGTTFIFVSHNLAALRACCLGRSWQSSGRWRFAACDRLVRTVHVTRRSSRGLFA